MISDLPLKKFRRRALIAGTLGAVAILAAAAFFIREGNEFFRDLIGKRLLEISWILSRQIDADAHAAIRAPADMESDVYRSVTTLLEGVQRNVAPEFSQVVSAYTIRIVGGKMILIVSPPADLNRDGKIGGKLEEREPAGLPYDRAPDEAMVGAAIDGTPRATSSFTTDRWGTWLTACSPLRTKEGTLDGAVCVNEDARDVRRSLFAVNLTASATSILIAILFVSALIEYLKTRMELAARTAAEKELERALRRFETAIENTPDVAVHALDRQGTILLWNRACERIYGFAKGEAMGRNFATLISQESERSEFQRDLEMVWAMRRPLTPRKWKVREKSGTEKHLLSTMFPILDGDTVIEIFHMGFDISRETQTRQELEKNIEQLQSLCQLMVGRESRVVELKKEINALCDQTGVPRRYGV